MDNLFEDKENEFAEEEKKQELPITYELVYPVVVGTEEITEIVLEKLPSWAAIDHLPLQDQKMGHFRPVVAAMTKYTAAQFKRIHSYDAIELIQLAVPFVMNSNRTPPD